MKTTTSNPKDQNIELKSIDIRDFNEANVDSEYEQNQRDIQAFNELLENETKEARESYKRAKQEYEAVFKKFLIKNVTGLASFDHHYKEGWNSAVNNLYPEVAMSLVDDLEVFGYIISEHYWWIEEGRYLSQSEEFPNEDR